MDDEDVIRKFSKSHDEQLSENFRLTEFACSCVYPACTDTYVSEVLIDGLQTLRDKCGPLKILSGFRCEKHNRDVGGQSNSFHKMGLAADLSSPTLTRYQLERAAKRVLPFSNGGLGVYSWGIHVDVRGFAARWHG